MAKKKSLEDRAYEKINREMKEYLAEIKTKSPEEIVEAAYEITYKQEILCMFECEGAFNDKQSLAILKTKMLLIICIMSGLIMMVRCMIRFEIALTLRLKIKLISSKSRKKGIADNGLYIP